MSRLFPRPAYAEDQPYAHTILTLHVLSRGFSVGAGVGSAIFLARRLLSRQPSPSSLLRGAGSGSLIGAGLLALALAGRMRGRDDIEWRDRSWRLLWNRGQAEVDEWWAAGAVLGGVGVGVLARNGVRGGARLGFGSVLGGMGLGSLVGMLGHAGWRYGVLGGFPGEERRL